jgi:hypothetical protein
LLLLALSSLLAGFSLASGSPLAGFVLASRSPSARFCSPFAALIYFFFAGFFAATFLAGL